MRRSTILMSAMALVLSASTAMAQAKPNFAGKWTLVPDPNATAGGGRGRGMGGLGAEATIAQDDKTITVTRALNGQELKSVYNLDGSDSKNTINFGQPIETLSKAKWDGDKLVVTTSINFNGNAIETTATYSLDSSGQLVVESSGMGGQGATKMTYKKG